MELVRSYRSTNFGLPTKPGRVGSCISLFEACSAFTHVTACTRAKSPSDSLHQRLQQFRCLHCCSDCYRVERTSSRAGLTPAVDHHLSRRTRFRDYTGKWTETVAISHNGPSDPDYFRLARHSLAIRHASMECPYQCYRLFPDSALAGNELLRGEWPALELLAN